MRNEAKCLNSGSPNLFNDNPFDGYAKQFADKGYCLLKDAISLRFLEFAREQLAELERSGKGRLPDWQIKNKKTQYLIDFPSLENINALFDAVARITSRPRDLMTLSERHYKIYSPNADPNPNAHKDRFQSQYSLGVPLQLGTNSKVVLWPDQSRALNQHPSTAAWRESLPQAELPENVLAGIPPLEIDVRVGDAVIFLGSSIFHERINAAGTIMAYFKLNALRCDPLAEDPLVELRANKGQALLNSLDDHQILDTAAELSPRVLDINIREEHDTQVQRSYSARLAGGGEVGLTQEEVTILNRLDPSLPLVKCFQGPPGAAELAALRRVIEAGVAVLLPEPITIAPGYGDAVREWRQSVEQRSASLPLAAQ